MEVKTFSHKFKGMRKPDNFVVYPQSDTSDRDRILVQGGRTIALVHVPTGKIVVNFAGSNPKYRCHLRLPGIVILTDDAFVAKAQEYMPEPGDTMGGGCVVLA
jgi:hypothetical protein